MIEFDWTGDDRRPCRACRNLIQNRYCQAARRGELPYVRQGQYEPYQGTPRRCEGYDPVREDPDRRPGSKRWPGLAAAVTSSPSSPSPSSQPSASRPSHRLLRLVDD